MDLGESPGPDLLFFMLQKTEVQVNLAKVSIAQFF